MAGRRKEVLVARKLALPPRKKRLGRHVAHDPRSWKFQALERPQIRSVLHKRKCPPFDQGETNSCTGQAVAGMLMTTPLYKESRQLTEGDALNLYARATHLDDFEGVYPAEDTGSTALAVMKAAKRLGYIKGYGHAFSLDQALRALVAGPVITGTYWYDSFYKPEGSNGRLKKSGHPIGGHEFLVVGLDVEDQVVRACNSYGTDYGDRGYFEMTFDLWDQLLHLNGDVTTPFVAK